MINQFAHSYVFPILLAPRFTHCLYYNNHFIYPIYLIYLYIPFLLNFHSLLLPLRVIFQFILIIKSNLFLIRLALFRSLLRIMR